MKLPTIINKSELKNRKILLRVDLNSTVVNGRIIESPRIKAHAETIKFLKKKRAKIIILAHQGSPGKINCLSLKSHARILNKYTKIKFVDETIGKKSWNEISKMKNGEVLLLENVRFLKEEFEPSTKNNFVDFFKEAGIELYVNDAFSVSHREHTSVVSFPKVFPSVAGPVLVGELKNIDKVKSKLKNCLFILGGKKTEDLIPLLKLKNRVLTTGKLSLIMLKSAGFKIVKENGLTNEDMKLVPKIDKIFEEGRVPVDLALNVKGKREEVSIKDLLKSSKRYLIFDIGSNTIEKYKKEIRNLESSKAILIKGAPGFYEKKGFEKGTKEILKAIADSRAFSIIAGGSISDAIKKFKINKKKFGYVSFSGGALVEFLMEGKLVGLSALRSKRNPVL